MRKPAHKKLTLRSETIRSLDRTRLDRVIGGDEAELVVESVRPACVVAAVPKP